MPHVTFSNDVSKVDGHAVTIEERRPCDTPYSNTSNPFIGRTIGASYINGIENRSETANNEALVIGPHGNIDEEINSTRVVENLVVRMGILKCGHRYRVLVPLPNLVTTSNEDEMNKGMRQLSLEQGTNANQTRIVRIDNDDLRGEIEDDGRHITAILSARQRGPYVGSLFIEMLPNNNLTNDCPAADLDSGPKCISIQIEASIMGKGMGTPQLRNGVVCQGKLVGYDSDEETEWQGFD